MNFNCIESIAEKYGAELERNVVLAPFTSFKIGGSCAAMLRANCAECVRDAVLSCKRENIPYRILGKGTNVLISDKGLDCLIILIGSAFSEIVVNESTIICDAGASLSAVCVRARENSLTGLEFAYGIPGSVGGALFMNAGAYGGEMKDVVRRCLCVDEKGEMRELQAHELELSYRHSVFGRKGLVILSVTLELKKGDKAEISERMNTLMEKRKTSQPLDLPSAGSTFKRPEGYFAAALIEQAGLKGFGFGGAQVSTKHSGFVVNKSEATFDDVIKTVEGVKEKVFEHSGVRLECEMLIWE